MAFQTQTLSLIGPIFKLLRTLIVVNMTSAFSEYMLSFYQFTFEESSQRPNRLFINVIKRFSPPLMLQHNKLECLRIFFGEFILFGEERANPGSIAANVRLGTKNNCYKRCSLIVLMRVKNIFIPLLLVNKLLHFYWIKTRSHTHSQTSDLPDFFIQSNALAYFASAAVTKNL